MSTSETDQESVEVDGSEPLQVVVVRLGRCLNELQHRMELAWLTVDGLHIQRISQLWRDIERLSRRLFVDEWIREDRADAVRRAKDDWNGQRYSEWHHESYCQMLKELSTLNRQGLLDTFGEETPLSLLESFLLSIPDCGKSPCACRPGNFLPHHSLAPSLLGEGGLASQSEKHPYLAYPPVQSTRVNRPP